MAKVSAKEVRSLELDEVLQVDIFGIMRQAVVMNILGVPTKMYAEDAYQIVDAFGMLVYEGDAEEIAGFATGLTGDFEGE